ncbi:run domain Beclin-1-interacting and cysteine-rich domain-containing protein [Aedes aegypti]|uniref:RUN domain-containing protein n=1 Tax=Aedes aegypti TaxID=7159 RepID=A0A1S4FV86_AEDAE|nr:run domain Beclin-1-interacting and cysteine-rich domain-containing protein [Aedes aegypti]
MEFTVKPSPSDTTSNECKEILAELITATNELRSHIRFQGATPQDADDGSSVLGTYDPNRLEPLYRCIKRIFTHKIMTFSEKNEPDVWEVIKGLQFSNPAISLHVTRARPAATVVSEDKGLLWIFQCVQQRCLSKNLNWLVNDKEHMGQCYESTAFLRDERYADAMMISFNALERGQPTLLSRIDPDLYAQEDNTLIGGIKRSESHPNFLLKDANKAKQEKSGLKRRQTIHHSNSRSNLRKEKISKVSRSLPNIALKDHYHSTRKRPPDCPDGNKENEVAEVIVPKFCYSGNESVPKPSLNVLNCDNIKIYTDSSSSSYQPEGACPAKAPNKSMESSSSKTDLFSLAMLTGSPRILLNEFIPQYGEKISKTNDNKSVGSLLSEIPSRPLPGQSLTSYLKTVSISRTNTELDRENAHFSLSEALIATFEQLKWNEGQAATRRSGLRKFPSNSNFWTSCPGSPQFFVGGHKSSEDSANNISPSTASRGSDSTAISSLSSGSSSVESGELHSKYLRQISPSYANHSSGDEDLEAVEASECGDVKTYSAEGVALSLLSKFNEKQLPTACEMLWLVSEQDAPQQLLPIPPDGYIANPDDQNGVNTIIRGTREWAPPRPQIIFTYCSQWSDRRAQMLKQNNRCAGCGMKVAQAYSSRFRYCHYLGKYNCSGCHKNQMAAIPAKVIERWDFTFYPVCTFAYRLLNDINAIPLYRINHLNPKLYEKVRVLQVARNIRKNLKYIKDFIMNCRFAIEMKGQMQNVAEHITSDLDSWSMADFISVRSGSFQKEKTDLIKRCEKHIYECELCIAHGFFCENCDRKEIIFPWQKRVVKCSKCGACYHDTCWLSDCVKCDRLQRRIVTRK